MAERPDEEGQLIFSLYTKREYSPTATKVNTVADVPQRCSSDGRQIEHDREQKRRSDDGKD